MCDLLFHMDLFRVVRPYSHDYMLSEKHEIHRFYIKKYNKLDWYVRMQNFCIQSDKMHSNTSLFKVKLRKINVQTHIMHQYFVKKSVQLFYFSPY